MIDLAATKRMGSALAPNGHARASNKAAAAQ
jgi:hypothetical protein